MQTLFSTWEEAHKSAQAMANKSGLSLGIEKPTQYRKEWLVRFLPKKEYRFGCDAVCEAVESDFIKKG